jgi:hypothetical protein
VKATRRLASEPGARAFSRSDTFHGDGDDWYTFALPLDQADELLGLLSGVQSLVRTSTIQSAGSQPPGWWTPSACPDLIWFKSAQGSLWHIGVSPSSGRVFIKCFRS